MLSPPRRRDWWLVRPGVMVGVVIALAGALVVTWKARFTSRIVHALARHRGPS